MKNNLIIVILIDCWVNVVKLFLN